MTPTVSPFLGFGIGTVGNSNFPSVNAFKGNWVSGPGKGQTMIDFSIYRSTLNGDITPGNALDGRYLLKNSGTFTFELAGAWTENDIRKEAVFGFGTAPDGTIFHLPEPSTYAMAVVGLAALACRQRFRRMGRGQRVPAA